MAEFSVLVAGKAGDGINQAGLLLAKFLGALGYRTYMYFDYPSLIRGGQNFSIVRASSSPVAAHRDRVDFLLALDRESISTHQWRLKDRSNIIYDSDSLRPEPATGSVGTAAPSQAVPGERTGTSTVVPDAAIGLPLKKILAEEGARPVMRNSCVLGAFAKCIGVDWERVEEVFKKNVQKALELNLKLASRGYAASSEVTRLDSLSQNPLPVLSGNEAVGMGLIAAGLRAYVAYPMTPSSSLLHFLADVANDFSLKVIHPENEIAVMLMALGFSYAGEKVAVGTSGGGFCLMTEGLSLAGMAELPIVVLVGQRPGPSTGLPTYTAQSELKFVLCAGQGEFPRFVVAPGDAEEAYEWSRVALSVAWKYQTPSIILSDKTLGEGGFNFDSDRLKPSDLPEPHFWDGRESYRRYAVTETGVSPLAAPPAHGAVVKVNSYEHDERGITTEESRESSRMCEKRLRKGTYLAKELENYRLVNVQGNRESETAVLCWGSNKGVCAEVGESLGLRVVQPIVLSPFPARQFGEALKGVTRIIAVENNATGQIADLVKMHGFNVDERISRYDGRPFSLEELEAELKKRQS
jgi:2-oxoglutarate ferredoxin oxidoreductase subunit alpha